MTELRSGFTTGTCAAAAAQAAACGLLLGRVPKQAVILTPSGKTAGMEIVEAVLENEWVRCGVYKDSGDDPDVTNGTLVAVTIEKNAGAGLLEEVVRTGYQLEEEPWLYLCGGAGIGIATRPGLSCPVGHYAINPVPRAMIIRAVAAVCREAGWTDPLVIRVEIPAGKDLAAKTFNPNLGIQGGLSVLGTSGVVEPMSEQALVETIRLDIRMKAAEGRNYLILTPGNYGEQFIKESLGIGLEQAVKCSNFLGDSVKMAAEEGIQGVLLTGHMGKLVKTAAGALNTHSAYGDRRMEGMLACMSDCFADNSIYRELFEQVAASNTTEEAADYLKEAGVLEPVMLRLVERSRQTLLKAAGAWALELEVMTFSSQYGFLGMTPGGGHIIEKVKEQERRR